jgi:phospholipid transport system transporter-binding protein
LLHDCLRAAAPGSQLNGSAVARIDTAGLQLLVAFIRERRAANQPVDWQSVSAAVRDTASLIGVSAALNLPLVS